MITFLVLDNVFGAIPTAPILISTFKLSFILPGVRWALLLARACGGFCDREAKGYEQALPVSAHRNAGVVAPAGGEGG
jgi:hypothetical protein